MQNDLRAAIFDLDGTLLNTLGDLTAGVNAALSAMLFPTRTEEEVRSFIGNGIPTLLRRALPAGTDDAAHAEATRRFTAYYMAHIDDRTVPYPGVPEMLQKLTEAGIRCAVVSNKKSEATKKLCDRQLSLWLSFVLGAADDSVRKPKPGMLLSAMAALGVTPSETVYIGDSDVDILTATNAGVRCISVAWGYRDDAFLRAHGAQRLAPSVEELTSLLLDF